MSAFSMWARALRMPLRRAAARWRGPCETCRRWTPGGGLCADCLALFAAPRPRCPRCALPMPAPAAGAAPPACGDCRQHPPPFDAAFAAVDYETPWDRLITDFKFHGRVELARPLAERLASAWPAHQAPPQLVLPMPLAAPRLRERGFNQAWELARRAAAAAGWPADTGLLQRWRDTAHQTGLDRAARERNQRDAFLVAPEARARVAGLAVALVDDVLTTGASAAAAAATLRAAGAASVSVWVLARTPAPPR